MLVRSILFGICRQLNLRHIHNYRPYEFWGYIKFLIILVLRHNLVITRPTPATAIYLMKNKLEIMLDMQEAMNSRVNADWREAKNEWYRAIWTECAEMLEHYGWKWWKHQQPDLDQVRLELVDIFHFAMSDYLLREVDQQAVVERIMSELLSPASETDIPCAIEAMAQSTIANQMMDFSDFANVMQLIDMDFDQLYRLYVGKNVLNFFRQDHGYKDGSYIKVWNGLEDNEHLTDLLNGLNSDSVDFKDRVYQGLQSRYPR